MKKVSADTVTELTAAAAIPPGAGGTPPTAKEMIDQIRTQLTLNVKSLAKSTQSSQNTGQQKKGGTKKNLYDISRDRAVRELQKFEGIVANVPKGFRLEPVLYTRIKQDQNTRIYSQFSSYVRPEFMRYLADNHAGELGALGICQQGIDRMKKGLNPVDPSGKLYDLNIDHIIERFGGGKVSLTQEIDPLMPPGSRPTYLVNHFSNFVLLPTQIHELKNSLNDLQDASQTPLGQSKWVLMIVPEADPGHSGYVAQPQGQLQSKQGHLRVYHMNAWQIAASTADQVDDILEGISQNPGMKERCTEYLDPALEDMAERLTEAFNSASRPRQDFKSFRRFYEGKKFSAQRLKMVSLPLEGAAHLSKTLQWIDEGIESRFNQRAVKKPANNNRRASKIPKVAKPVISTSRHVPKRKKQKKHGNHRH